VLGKTIAQIGLRFIALASPIHLSNYPLPPFPTLGRAHPAGGARGVDGGGVVCPGPAGGGANQTGAGTHPTPPSILWWWAWFGTRGQASRGGASKLNCSFYKVWQCCTRKQCSHGLNDLFVLAKQRREEHRPAPVWHGRRAPRGPRPPTGPPPPPPPPPRGRPSPLCMPPPSCMPLPHREPFAARRPGGSGPYIKGTTLRRDAPEG